MGLPPLLRLEVAGDRAAPPRVAALACRWPPSPCHARLMPPPRKPPSSVPHAARPLPATACTARHRRRLGPLPRCRQPLAQPLSIRAESSRRTSALLGRVDRANCQRGPAQFQSHRWPNTATRPIPAGPPPLASLKPGQGLAQPHRADLVALW